MKWDSERYLNRHAFIIERGRAENLYPSLCRNNLVCPALWPESVVPTRLVWSAAPEQDRIVVDHLDLKKEPLPRPKQGFVGLHQLKPMQ